MLAKIWQIYGEWDWLPVKKSLNSVMNPNPI